MRRLADLFVTCAAGLAAFPVSAQIHIAEVCPQPAAKHPTTGDTIDAPDPNGRVSGWVELVNTSETDSVDLGNYELQRFNLGKKASTGKFTHLPSRSIAPGERLLVYTSESYDNAEDLGGDGKTVTEYATPDGGTMIVVPFKVNPKKGPMVRLIDYSSNAKGVVVDTVYVPNAIDKGVSVVAGTFAGTSYEKERLEISETDVLETATDWTADKALAWREPLADDEAKTDLVDADYAINASVAVRAAATDAEDVERHQVLDYADAPKSADPDSWLVSANAVDELADSSDVTICLWFFAPASAAPAAGSHLPLFDARTDDSADSSSVSLALTDAGALVASRGESAVVSGGATSLFDGAWHHVALALGRTAGARYALYLDGTAVVDTASDIAGAAVAVPDASKAATFTGVQTRPAVFARSLEASEIAALAAWDGPETIDGSAMLSLPDGAVSVRIATTLDPAETDAAVSLSLDGTVVQPDAEIPLATLNEGEEHVLCWVVEPSAAVAGSLALTATATVERVVVDTITIPAGGATVRYLSAAPTPLSDTATAGLPQIGPTASPLFGIKHSLSDWKAFPRAQPGADYAVSMAVNPVSDLPGDAIESVRLIYRSDFGAIVTNGEEMVRGATDKSAGQLWAGSIPAAALPAAGHLVRWALLVTDAAGRTWRAPTMFSPDIGYEWYGTIVEPEADQVSENLQTFHLFVNPANHLAQMDVDIDAQNRSLVPYGARVGVYDGQTGLYYDNVRIDLRGNTSGKWPKKSHGLRFNKVQPLSCTDPVTGQTLDGLRKTSFIAEWPDPAHIRQALSFHFFREAGCNVPFDYPVRLQLNGAFYQLAFHSNRFTDELIEDWYGFDPEGYAYKNVGTFASFATTGAIEKKTPDDGNELDVSVLKAMCDDLAGSRVTETDDDSVLDNAALTRKVVKHFDLPAWFNYLAVARLTGETDDTWANISAYYDVNGTGTWMPLAYDLNSSFGQFYQADGIGKIGPMSDQDWFKAHPFYGGYRILAHKSATGGSIGGAQRGNRAIDAIYQDARFRRMYLRRLRTLMDEILKAPDTPQEDTPFWQWVSLVTDAEWADARLDQLKWGEGTSTEIWVWNHAGFNWDSAGNPTETSGLDDLWENYVVPRRRHLFVTHSVANTAWEIGYAVGKNAGIPDSQKPTEVLRAGFSLPDAASRGFPGREMLRIANANADAVDMSGWVLSGAVSFTFAPGTVIDAGGTLIVTADRKSWIEAHLEQTDGEMIVGNAVFSPGEAMVRLVDANGVPVFAETTPAGRATLLILR